MQRPNKPVLCVFLYYKGKDGWKYGYHMRTYNLGETNRVIEREKKQLGHGDPRYFRLFIAKCSDRWEAVEAINKTNLAKIKGEIENGTR